RIAFYAPLKAPTHEVPSGDRLMAQQLLQALASTPHVPFLASTFRSYEGKGDPDQQRLLRGAAAAETVKLIAGYQRAPQTAPEGWFTYHLYYKAPDWLGPPICDALDIPYVVAEPSFAPKRATGPWRMGHENVAKALRRADVALCLTRYDMEFVGPQIASPERRLRYLPPFIDASRLDLGAQVRSNNRTALAAALALPADATWLITVAMMRPGDKLASYRQLAQALAVREQNDVCLLIVGDGSARNDVEAAFQATGRIRVRFLGMLEAQELGTALSAADIYVWPAVGEAYGMALLEAQAAGLPVVAGRVRGVVDVVRDGQTGLLAEPDDPVSFAAHLARLVDNPILRQQYATAARDFVLHERNVEAAGAILGEALDFAVGSRGQ
ncbi:MAG: glycosyltransferase family 4 protein, partial [Proteobacteria bacterium]|nr:glycosyltransferase family 4 protein [Pseudomonadota bacterium]